MLPRNSRLRSGPDFTTTLRTGRRCATKLLSVHLLLDDSAPPARAGVTVSRAVGIAVVRNRVKRRLRAALREVLAPLPGERVVVRAFPSAAHASFNELSRDLAFCLTRLRGQPA